MRVQAALLRQAVARHWRRWLAISAGFVVLYYAGLLLFTVLRFREIPNYVEIYDVVGSYRQILRGTPAWSDAWPILLDEPWLEAGFKDPHYYGVASWSYVLIPPKMLVVFLAGALLATILVLAARSRDTACPGSAAGRAPTYAAAALGSAFIGLTGATLTWVVCCATPSWVVALTMLGMSTSLALWLDPLGGTLTASGFLLLAGAIAHQLRRLGRLEGATP
jgi:hypothetical protein